MNLVTDRALETATAENGTATVQGAALHRTTIDSEIDPAIDPATAIVTTPETAALLQGDVLLKLHPYSAWGGAVTARLYFPLTPKQIWPHLIDYPRWTQYFPDVTRSEVLHTMGHTMGHLSHRGAKRLYQVASKAFVFFTAQVEIYLQVLETQHQSIQFRLESGHFKDFVADLQLQNCGEGTLLTYSVQATPTIPVPKLLIEQAIQFDLPANLRQMRRVICGKS